MDMSFDPPPTADRNRNKSRQSAHRLPSFASSRQPPSQEPPAYTTDDILAYKHQKYSKLVSWLRIALSLITLAISVAIVACSGSSLRAYSGSGFAGEWWLPIWPLSVDLRPTHAVLACGIVLLSASLIYLTAALFPSVVPCHWIGTWKGFLLIRFHVAPSEISSSQHYIDRTLPTLPCYYYFHHYIRNDY